MDARKILLVIFDGLGDRPLTELGHKTPLEATPKPKLREGTEHRVAGWLRGGGLSPKIAATDPHEMGETIRESKPLESAAKVTAKAVNAFTQQSQKILKSHPVTRARVAKGEPPANAIVLRGAGIFPDLVSITERFHLTAAGIAGVALVRGMFRTFGMDVIDVRGATGGLDTDMIAEGA